MEEESGQQPFNPLGRLGEIAAEPLTELRLSELADDDLVVVVHERIYRSLPGDIDQWPTAFMLLPLGWRLHHLVIGFDAEVDNGGFDQYFFNRPDDAKPAREALEHIGAMKASAILRQAIEAEDTIVRKPGWHPWNVDRDRRLEALEDRYYALEEADRVEVALAGYIRTHSEEFIEEESPLPRSLGNG